VARILIADDEEGLREFLREALEDEGHVVLTARDGQEALDEARRHGFDVLVTDLKMPRLDGIELVRRLRAEQPELEILVLTAHGTVDSAVEAMRLGAFDFVQKPLASPDQIRLLVRRALERRSLHALRDQAMRGGGDLPPLSHGDPAMDRVVTALRKVAPTPATVLLVGESGTGKELAARAVHAWSPRAQGPFVAVNCAAISESLLESELFGHEKGAFTGASAARRGWIELASGGTFLLDEVGELAGPLQAKLLRVIQERRFERVGGARTIEADVRWIAATNRDLEACIERGTFREDLYHRLATFPVRLPPLRERRADIVPLAEVLLRDIARDLGRPSLELTDDARDALQRADWPGNVRELANVLEQAAILAEAPVLRAGDLPIRSRARGAASGATPDAPRTLEAIERHAIEQALGACDGNRRRAAERLGIGVRTLYEKLKRYGIA
jgi:two-component system response regulator FlrC